MKETYDWTLKIINKHSNDNIGIVEKINQTSSNYLFYNEDKYGDSYYWWNHTGRIWRKSHSNYFKTFASF